jgi:hypothetical protein
MNDGIMLSIGEDGIARAYDDTYDITIHCESSEEQEEVRKALENFPRWIPCSERLPKDKRQVLVYARSVHYALAKYDEMRNADGTYKKQWVTFDAWKPFYTIKEVIAWMPLPEPYWEGLKDERSN